jgi:hypothetical protein
MEGWAFNQDDLRHMANLGIAESQVRAQRDLFQGASLYLRLNRSCTVGDGIEQITAEEAAGLIDLQEEAARDGRFIKFVPASGAATRMFQGLLTFYLNRSSFDQDKIHPELSQRVSEAEELVRFFSGIHRFAFFEGLKESMAREGLNIINAVYQKQWHLVLDHLLTEQGLNYLNRPKGLHLFHTYPGHTRTAFEEHLVEAAHTVCDQTGLCHLHVTISPEHEDTFREFFKTLRPIYESLYHCRFKVTFSFQNHSTDTLAVDLENRPFRDDSGKLLFRPGGHGALLQNLNDLQGDLIYIKNIDNVVPDRLKKPTIDWKKILGGYLVKVQKKVHGFLRKLDDRKESADFFSEVRAFCRDRLWIIEPAGINSWSREDQKKWLVNLLNRPIRICGMVRNEGEPGGGPFWVEDKDGTLSMQIVESTQIDPASAEQKALWASSAHFNPVDLICSVRDYEGHPFDLNRYVDQEAVFIARKSHNGRDFKALELPGLWNGSMAKWISLFIEVPNQTFRPVKTINDLLRPEHQNEV